MRFRLVLTLLFLGLYLWGLAPSITWEDSARYHWLLDQGDALYGGADHYRLYFSCLGVFRKLPLGDEAWGINLFHAVTGVVSLNLFFSLLCQLGVRSAGAAVGAVFLGVSHLFWHYAEVTKVYPLVILFLVAVLWLTCRGIREGRPVYLLIAGYLYGVGWGTHPLIVPIALPILLVLAGARSLRRHHLLGFLVGGVVGWVVALAFYAVEIREIGLLGWMQEFLFSGHGALDNPVSQGSQLVRFSLGRLPLDLAEWLGYLGYQFLWGILLGVWGIFHLFRRERRLGALLLLAYLVYAFIPFDFNVSLKINFYLPSFVIFAAWIGCGVERLLAVSRAPGRAALGMAVLVLGGTPMVYHLTAFELLPKFQARRFQDRPDAGYKDRIRFYLWPSKRGFDEPEHFARRALEAMSPGCLVVVDFQEFDVLNCVLSRQLVAKRFDVRHESLQGKEAVGRLVRLIGEESRRRKVLVGVQYRGVLESEFKLERKGVLWEVRSGA
jgi:hypothetical protein